MCAKWSSFVQSPMQNKTHFSPSCKVVTTCVNFLFGRKLSSDLRKKNKKTKPKKTKRTKKLFY
jgi:archaeosine-15-forming tRNA-guanine transglycosylase